MTTKKLKATNLNLRITPQTKQLLEIVAQDDARSITSMVEILVKERARARGLSLPDSGVVASS
jgi:hypothetical protein